MKKMMKAAPSPLLIALTVAVALHAPLPWISASRAAEDDLEAKIEAIQKEKKARILSVVEKNKESVVIVEIVVNATISIQGQQRPPQEQKIRLNGTTISEDGVTVISNSRSDPMAQLGSRARKMPGLKIDIEVLESKIILNDGTEIPAKIVLKDQDLDLAFVKPKEEKKGMAHVKLAADTKPELLDSVTGIMRLDMEANRTTIIKTGQIGGIIEKPRKYYQGPSMNPGLPAFDSDGRCIGLFLRRMGTSGPTGSPAILPAEEILTAVKQIGQKGAEEKKEEKKE